MAIAPANIWWWKTKKCRVQEQQWGCKTQQNWKDLSLKHISACLKSGLEPQKPMKTRSPGSTTNLRSSSEDVFLRDDAMTRPPIHSPELIHSHALHLWIYQLIHHLSRETRELLAFLPIFVKSWWILNEFSISGRRLEFNFNRQKPQDAPRPQAAWICRSSAERESDTGGTGDGTGDGTASTCEGWDSSGETKRLAIRWVGNSIRSFNWLPIEGIYGEYEYHWIVG